MEEPRDFPKALFLLQGFALVIYVIVGVTIYVFVGRDVVSPALGSASPVVKKAAYGTAVFTVRSFFRRLLV